jgi:hypothetical protein
MSGPNLTPGSPQRTTASADAVMKGHGFYNEHSRPQQTADSLGLPLLGRTVEEMTVPQGAEPAAVADFGAAQGRNSLGADAPRRREDTKADDVLHPDSGYPH